MAFLIASRHSDEQYLKELGANNLSYATGLKLSDKSLRRSINNILGKKTVMDKRTAWRLLIDDIGISIPHHIGALEEELLGEEDLDYRLGDLVPTLAGKQKVTARKEPRIIEDLEKIALAAFKEQEFESVDLDTEMWVWCEAQINPEEVYFHILESIGGNVKPVWERYIAVRVTDSRVNDDVVSISRPGEKVDKGLKHHYIRAADIIGHVRDLCEVLYHVVDGYFERTGDGNVTLKALAEKKPDMFERVFYGNLLDRQNEMNGLYADGNDYLTNEQLKNCESLSSQAALAIQEGKMEFENNLKTRKGGHTVNAGQLYTLIQDLIDLVPKEIFELRKVKHMHKVNPKYDKTVYFSSVRQGEQNAERLHELQIRLGSVQEGLANVSKKSNLPNALKTLYLYVPRHSLN